ncbi:MAG: hypothetical protein GC161_07005 [Planctomycetaceae bacterium]|nr:hypothetical protein [Planctomycetaceae bacterium]
MSFSPPGPGPRLFPRRARAALAAIPFCALAACAVPRPTPEALIETGFRTPAQTVRSFQSALAADLVDLEYRCFATSFKRREGLTQLTWRAYRAELLARWPALRRLATAHVETPEELAADRVLVRGRVEYLWYDFDFEVELVREDFYELYVDGLRALDDAIVWDGVLWVEGQAEDWPPPSLAARLPLSEPVDPSHLSELRLGREWKIDALRRVER